jgi:hypothetical protein
MRHATQASGIGYQTSAKQLSGIGLEVQRPNLQLSTFNLRPSRSSFIVHRSCAMRRRHRASASRFNTRTFNFRRSTFDLHRSCLVSPPSTERREGV